MITIEYKGMCEGCKYADLELKCAGSRSDGSRCWRIQCVHETVCWHMKNISRIVKGTGEANEQCTD